MSVLYLNNDAVVKFTNKLEQLSHTAMPNVVRKTLNDAALDVKQKTMPKTATVFTQRQKNFFTGTSRVEFAKNTHDINQMQSSVGFMDKGLKGANNYSVKDLLQQEQGGDIAGRAFIPMADARVGGSNTGLVKSKFRLTEINKLIVNAANFQGKSDKEKFTKAAIAAGKGGFVIGVGVERNFIFQINAIKKATRGNKLTGVVKTPIYSVKAHRQVHVKGTNFMAIATQQTTKKIEDIYIENAKARFERELK